MRCQKLLWIANAVAGVIVAATESYAAGRVSEPRAPALAAGDDSSRSGGGDSGQGRGGGRGGDDGDDD